MTNIKKLRREIFVAIVLVSSAALAGQIVEFVNAVRVDATGKGIIYFDSNITGVPDGGCGSSIPNGVAFDTNTAAGRAIHAMATSAMLAGKKLNVETTNSCTFYGGGWVYDYHIGAIAR